MLQTKEDAASRAQAWFKSRPHITETDGNLALLIDFISKHFAVAGQCVIDSNLLDLAAQNLADKLQYAASPETQAQIVEANRRAAALLAEKARQEKEAAEAAEKARIREERFARQQAAGPGRRSAFEGQEAERARLQQEAERRSEQQALAQERAFVMQKLHEIDLHQEYAKGGGMISYSRTADAKLRMKNELAAQHPKLRTLIFPNK